MEWIEFVKDDGPEAIAIIAMTLVCLKLMALTSTSWNHLTEALNQLKTEIARFREEFINNKPR